MTNLEELRTVLTERRRDWWEDWRDEGLAAGLAEGRAKGLAEGLTEGRLTGEAQVLRKLLVRRFGQLSPEAEARLAGATENELMDWAEKILDVESVEGLLG